MSAKKERVCEVFGKPGMFRFIAVSIPLNEQSFLQVAVLENQNKALIEELKTLKELYCR